MVQCRSLTVFRSKFSPSIWLLNLVLCIWSLFCFDYVFLSGGNWTKLRQQGRTILPIENIVENPPTVERKHIRNSCGERLNTSNVSWYKACIDRATKSCLCCFSYGLYFMLISTWRSLSHADWCIIYGNSKKRDLLEETFTAACNIGHRIANILSLGEVRYN